MQTLSINIDIDADVLVSMNQSSAEFSTDLKLWAAISLFQFGKLSLAAAANLAGFHRYDFENKLADLGIPISRLQLEDVEKELEMLKDL
jgi:predicted HTH domain antitoxin